MGKLGLRGCKNLQSVRSSNVNIGNRDRWGKPSNLRSSNGDVFAVIQNMHPMNMGYPLKINRPILKKSYSI